MLAPQSSVTLTSILSPVKCMFLSMFVFYSEFSYFTFNNVINSFIEGVTTTKTHSQASLSWI